MEEKVVAHNRIQYIFVWAFNFTERVIVRNGELPSSGLTVSSRGKVTKSVHSLTK